MKQEDRELLLKDLCARLPYNPMVEYKGESYNVLGITHGRLVLCTPFMSYTLNVHPLVEEVKPHLFPLSSMTEEQKEELENLGWYFDNFEIHNVNEYFGTYRYREYVAHSDCFELIDWLNKNHFDYRGLIEKGLAIDCTNLNIY